MIELLLPWPPSANTYYRNLGGRTVISKRGRIYKQAVAKGVLMAKANVHLAGRLEVGLLLLPPDNRRRDIDNSIKPAIDALKDAGVMVDDCQIDRLSVTRGHVEKGGLVVATIRQAPPIRQ